MREELEKKLFEKYPDIFGRRELGPQHSLLHFGLAVGDGWYDLIATLCSLIQNDYENELSNFPYRVERGEAKAENKPLPVYAEQVKEKFGGLRFYVGPASPRVHGMIEMAEALSYKICEECGQKGTLRRGGWWHTMCDPCEAAYQAKRNVETGGWGAQD